MYVRQRIENFRLDRRISNTMVKNFDTIPELWDKSDSETTLNAPWILSRAMLLLSKTSLTLDEVWNMPLGELLWYCAVFAEQEGVAQIQSDTEKRIIEEIKNGNK